MTLPEAVEIYRTCDDKIMKECETCPLNDKERVGDISICALLTYVEKRSKDVKPR
mgnify:CR=1 FL=1